MYCATDIDMHGAQTLKVYCLFAGICSAWKCNELGGRHVFHVLLPSATFSLLPYSPQT